MLNRILRNMSLRSFLLSERTLQILPGAVLWITLIFAFVSAFVFPLGAVVFILLFDLYWLFRVAYFLPYLLSSWASYRRALRTDWPRELAKLPSANSIYHVIFLPTYKEDISVIRETLRSFQSSSFPVSRMIIVLAGEERDATRFRKQSVELSAEFSSVFHAFFVTEHPKDLPEEIPGKGSNLNFSGKAVLPKLLALNIPVYI